MSRTALVDPAVGPCSRRGTAVVLVLLLCSAGPARAQYWRFPPAPPPSEYGNLLIDRLSEKSGRPAVTFSHWSHRRRYTCRVCHFELGFEMRANATEITEEACRKGRFCGACHDGKEVFGQTDPGDCGKCHNGDPAYGSEKFQELAAWPKAPYGNHVDWVQALEVGLIHPRSSLEPDYTPMTFTKRLTLEAGWTMIPPAYFSHEVHNRWLDCANCHPDIFNIKKRATAHFSMKYNLEGKFCGACHGKVAFPLNDCRRCHPGIKE